ncbi:MAG: histidine--tRNA ligase family protein [Deltaproteobacteria bacterium]|nr:histidine--tRNA ligase family protein [Deltaproteobacteria bacterium]
MKTQRCKGTRDLSPGEMAVFRLIEGTFRDACRKWGYEEVRTPTLEYLHLFTSVGTLTPGMLGRVYSFLDWDGWSGERVVLRPDGTIPVARLYIDSLEKEKLAKLFYVANTFIFEATGEKTRERWQCGAEMIGVSSPSADVELVMLALEVLQRLQIDGVKLKMSHAGLIRALLARLGLSSEEQARVFDRILDGDGKELAELGLDRTKLETLSALLGLKGKSSTFVKGLKALLAPDLAGLQPGIDDLVSVAELLESLGADYQIDLASVRDFEYYTGAIFQIFRGKDKIGGGGRYDALIPLMGGRDTPASGVALYLDRLMGLVKPEALTQVEAPKVLVRAKPEVSKEGFSLVARLHKAGYRAEFNLGAQSRADFGWTLDVQSQAPKFILTDRAEKKFEARTISEVLKLLAK